MSDFLVCSSTPGGRKARRYDTVVNLSVRGEVYPLQVDLSSPAQKARFYRLLYWNRSTQVTYILNLDAMDLKSFQKYAGLLDAEIKRRRSKTIFYQTWANRHRPESLTRLTDAYQGVADEFDAILAPVGQAWARAQDLFPEIGLCHKDGRYASPVGAYLTACVFYSVVLNSSPEGLPACFFIEGKMRPSRIRFMYGSCRKLLGKRF